MVDTAARTEISFPGRFASSAIAACFAELCTIPLDTAKVRLQLQKKAVTGDAIAAPQYKGMLGTVATIAREEGLAALWKGIIPGLHRQCLYGGLRIGLYEPIKSVYVGDDFVGDISLSKKILAGLTTGAIAIAVASPTDLVKVRLQAEGKLPAGVPRCYSGALNAYHTIIRQEGLGALWTGLGPNIVRNAIINAAELASYDQVKQEWILTPVLLLITILKIPGFSDNMFTHLLAGLGAGLFAVCIGSPVDVVKSRMMGDSTYKSTLDCFIRTLKNEVATLRFTYKQKQGIRLLKRDVTPPDLQHLYKQTEGISDAQNGAPCSNGNQRSWTPLCFGPFAFYKGFFPNFGRLGSWNVIMFLTLEQNQSEKLQVADRFLMLSKTWIYVGYTTPLARSTSYLMLPASLIDLDNIPMRSTS
ncbi:hypothetical protein M5K25_003270 [Dendrobium thyrsiflorum]|uniref:Uncoupling protein n=1 Tax=Dendrobium thyrsiflorum TaxID=117978 RepID=A0ABD0VPN3_DENTH